MIARLEKFIDKLHAAVTKTTLSDTCNCSGTCGIKFDKFKNCLGLYIIMAKIRRNILAKCIVEMVGAPKEHLEKTMKDYIKSLKEREDLEIIKSDYSEPEEKEKMFNMFVELEAWFQDTPGLIGFCIDSLPSSVEILEPEKLTFTENDMSDFVNDLLGKLHVLDMSIKKTNAKVSLLDKNVNVIAANFIAYIVRNEAKGLDELQKITGIDEKMLGSFLDKMVEQGSLVKEEDKYRLK